MTIMTTTTALPRSYVATGALKEYESFAALVESLSDADGRAPERGDGLHASVVYLVAELTKRGWGPATLVLDGEPRHDIGVGGPEITGDALQFVLVATGRADASTMDLDPTVNIYAG